LNRFSLRQKVALLSVITIFLFVLLVYGWLHWIVLRSFKTLERKDALKEINTIFHIISYELGHIQRSAEDWSFWDDTYEYVQTKNKHYEESNLVPSTFVETHLNLILIADTKGKIVYEGSYDFRQNKPISFAEFNKAHLDLHHPFFRALKQKEIKGILLTEHGPLFVVACAILKSDESGPPRGILAMGRLIDKDFIEAATSFTHCKVSVYLINTPNLPAEIKKTLLILKNKPYFIRPLNLQTIAAYALFKDIRGKPAFVLKVEKPRFMYKTFKGLIKRILLIFTIAGLLGATAGFLLYEKAFLQPLFRVINTLKTVTLSQDLTKRVPVERKDEIGQLAQTINSTLEKIEKSQKALAAEKEFLSLILSSLTEGVIVTNKENRIILMNAMAEELTGFKKEKAIGKPFEDIFIPETQAYKDIFKTAIRNGRAECLYQEMVLKSKNGKKYIIELTIAPLNKDNQTSGIIVIFRDVSEKRRVELELARMQRLGAIGVLAAGIAHEFNNLLMGILGNISVAKALAHSPQKAIKALEKAEEIVGRSRKLTSRLLAFAEGGFSVKEKVDIVSLIQEKTYAVLKDSNIKVKFHLPPGLWPVKGDKHQIGQVIKHLVSNAVAAMKHKGKFIYISGKNVEIKADNEIPNLKKGRYVKISIRDEGEGIPPEEIEKIFLPFYTSKPNAIGLGLSLCYAVIKKHGGYITVTSEVGKGTTFTFYLPAA